MDTATLNPTPTAWASPSAGAAVVWAADGWRRLPVRGEAEPTDRGFAQRFVAQHDDVVERAFVHEDELRAWLAGAARRDRALRMLVGALDRQVPAALRDRLVRQLEADLRHADVAELLRARLLSRVAPAEADFIGAMDACVRAHAPTLNTMLGDALDAQPQVSAVLEARTDHLAALPLEQQVIAVEVAQRDDVVAVLVDSLVAGGGLGARVLKLANLDRHQVPGLNRWSKGAAARLGKGKRSDRSVDVMLAAQREWGSEFESRKSDADHSAHRERVHRTRTRVLELLRLGKADEASGYALELAEVQRRFDGNGEYAAQTLCSVAAQAEERFPAVAEIWLLAARDFAPTDPFPSSQLITLYRRRQQWDAAFEASRRALNNQPSDAATHRTFAELCRARGRFDDAENAYRTALAIEPVNGVAWCGLAELFRARGKFEAAEEAYKAAQTLDSKNAIAWSGFAELCRARGEFDDAERAYRTSLEAIPDDIVAWCGFAELCRARGRFEDAEHAYRTALKLDPKDVVAWAGFAELCRARGRFAEAEDAYRTAQKINPNNVVAWTGLGELWLNLHRATEAEAAFEQARAVNPADTYAKFGLARIFALRKEWSAAESILAAPENDQSKGAWYLQRARGIIALMRGDLSSAQHHLSQVVELCPWQEVQTAAEAVLATVRLRERRTPDSIGSLREVATRASPSLKVACELILVHALGVDHRADAKKVRDATLPSIHPATARQAEVLDRWFGANRPDPSWEAALIDAENEALAIAA